MLGTLAFYYWLMYKTFVWRGPSSRILHIDNSLFIKDLVFLFSFIL